MLAFRMTAEQACLFFEVCQAINAETEEDRVKVLGAMAKLGQVGSITETNMSKEDYIRHIQDKFGKVLNITKGDLQNG